MEYFELALIAALLIMVANNTRKLKEISNKMK